MSNIHVPKPSYTEKEMAGASDYVNSLIGYSDLNLTAVEKVHTCEDHEDPHVFVSTFPNSWVSSLVCPFDGGNWAERIYQRWIYGVYNDDLERGYGEEAKYCVDDGTRMQRVNNGWVCNSCLWTVKDDEPSISTLQQVRDNPTLQRLWNGADEETQKKWFHHEEQRSPYDDPPLFYSTSSWYILGDFFVLLIATFLFLAAYSSIHDLFQGIFFLFMLLFLYIHLRIVLRICWIGGLRSTLLGVWMTIKLVIVTIVLYYIALFIGSLLP